MTGEYSKFKDRVSSFSFFKRKKNPSEITAPSFFNDALYYWNDLIKMFPELNYFTGDYSPNLENIQRSKKLCSLAYLLYYVQPFLIDSVQEDNANTQDGKLKCQTMYAAISALGNELFPGNDWTWLDKTDCIPTQLDRSIVEEYTEYLQDIINAYCRNFMDSKLIGPLIKLKVDLNNVNNRLPDIYRLLQIERDTQYKSTKAESLLNHITTAGISPLKGKLERIEPITSSVRRGLRF